MTSAQPLFHKLNLKDQTSILVLDAPASFEPELAALAGVRVLRRPEPDQGVSFALAFAVTRAELDRCSRELAVRAEGDAILWIAYPKQRSRRYTCEFNRDRHWEVLEAAGFETVRMVAIDEDWSAVRWRRSAFVKRR